MLDVIEKVMGIAEAAAIVGALAVAWFEFRRAKREASFANYADHMKGFLEMTQLLVEKPELHDIYNYSVADDDREYAELTAAEKSRLHYCDMLLTLCETVWSAYEQKLLLGREWEYVQGWIRQLGESPDFRRAVKWCGDTSDYTDEFMQTVRRLVRQGHENLKARTEAVGA